MGQASSTASPSPDPESISVPKAVACPRTTLTSEHSDWYRPAPPENYPLNICPTCFEGLIAPTPYASRFQESRTKPEGELTRCIFWNYWVRLGWARILQTRAQSLEMLYKAANVVVRDGDCTRSEPAERQWWSVKDPDSGKLLTTFTACSWCVYSADAVLPHLKGVFVRVGDGVSRGTCDLGAGTEGVRDLLVGLIVAEAVAERTGLPDMRHFANHVNEITARKERAINEAQAKPGQGSIESTAPQPQQLKPSAVQPNTLNLTASSLPQCQKGETVTGPCHFIPSFSCFTVCPRCYVETIAPFLASSRIASQFITTPQRLQGGFFCHAFSTRMRNICKDAFQTDDFTAFKQKALQREAKRKEVVSKLEALKTTYQLQMQQKDFYMQSAGLEQMQHAAVMASSGSRLDGQGPIFVNANTRNEIHWQRSNDLMNQSNQAFIQAQLALQQITLITRDWETNWE